MYIFLNINSLSWCFIIFLIIIITVYIVVFIIIFTITSLLLLFLSCHRWGCINSYFIIRCIQTVIILSFLLNIMWNIWIRSIILCCLLLYHFHIVIQTFSQQLLRNTYRLFLLVYRSTSSWLVLVRVLGDKVVYKFHHTSLSESLA